MSRKYLVTSLGLAAAAFLLPDAFAQDGGYLTVGVSATPEYEGSPDQQIIPFVAGRYDFGDRSVALEGLTVRADLLSSPDWEAGPAASYTFGRDKDVDTVVRFLPEIDGAVEAGGYVAYNWLPETPDGTSARLSLQAVQDISDAHDGWILTSAFGVSRPLSDRFQIGAEISASIVSDDYAETYFSVDPAGALATGLAPYSAEGGLKDIGLSLSSAWAATETWSLTGYTGYKRLLGDAADSPIVADAGDENQFTVGVGIGRSF